MTKATALDPFVVIRDTREPEPPLAWDFGPDVIVRVAKLDEGDYAPESHVGRVVLERKTIPDLLGCMGRERSRYEGMLERMTSYERAAVIVEGDLETLITGSTRSRIDVRAVLGSIGSFWGRYGIAHIWAGSRRNSSILALRMMMKAAKWVGAPPAAGASDEAAPQAAE